MVNPDEAASAPQSSSDTPQAQAQLAQQHITVTNRQLNITPFVIDRDPTNTANRWDKWKKDIEHQFRFFGIYDLELKKDGLIIYGGHDIANLKDSLPDVETTDPPADAYTKFIRKLDKYFLPKKNKDYARFQLGNLQQEEDESLAKYFASVREIANVMIKSRLDILGGRLREVQLFYKCITIFPHCIQTSTHAGLKVF